MDSPRRSLALFLGVFVIFVVAGLVIGGLWLASGQPESPTAGLNQESASVALEGIVQFIGGGVPTTWVVNRYSVQVVASTQVITHGVPVAVGDWAQVEAVKVDNGLQATTIALRRAPMSELYDRIASIDVAAGQWQVGNTRVELAPDTDIQGTPLVGSLAMVYGQRSAEGIIADEIVVTANAPDTVVVGTLLAMSGTTWLVDDVSVMLDPTTVISGTPILNRQVQVLGLETGPQQMRAVRAWVEDASEHEERLVGWLQRIDGTRYPYLWRVNRVDGPQAQQDYLSVYEDVVLDDSAGPVTPGVWLEVVGWRQDASFYRGASIVVLPRPPKREIMGLVEALPYSGLVGRWQVAGYQVDVSVGTGILGLPQVGSLVRVQGTPNYANVLQAEQIDVQGN